MLFYCHLDVLLALQTNKLLFNFPTIGNCFRMYGGKGSPAMKTNFINGGAPK